MPGEFDNAAFDASFEAASGSTTSEGLEVVKAPSTPEVVGEAGPGQKGTARFEVGNASPSDLLQAYLNGDVTGWAPEVAEQAPGRYEMQPGA